MKTTMNFAAISTATLVALLAPADASVIRSGDFNGTYTSAATNSVAFTPVAGNLYGVSAAIDISPFTWTADDQTANFTSLSFNGSPTTYGNGQSWYTYGGGVVDRFVNTLSGGGNPYIGGTTGAIYSGFSLDTRGSTWTIKYYYGGTGFDANSVYQGATAYKTVANITPFAITQIDFSYNPYSATGGAANAVVSNFVVTSVIRSGDFNGTYTSAATNSVAFIPVAGNLYGVSAAIDISPFTWTADDQTANFTSLSFNGSPTTYGNGQSWYTYGGGVVDRFVNTLSGGGNPYIGGTTGAIYSGFSLDTRGSTWTIKYYYGGTGFDANSVYQGATAYKTAANITPFEITQINFYYDPNSATGGAANAVVSNFVVTAIPSSPSYGAWAATNAGGQAANLDLDNDGVPNGVEYFMNAAPGFTSNPSIDGTNKVTWSNGGKIPSSAYGTQFVVQTSTDLETWEDVSEGQLDENTDGPGGSLSYIVSGSGKEFVRLKVTPN